MLHTWARDRTLHPHAHCIVTAAGLSLDGARWVDNVARRTGASGATNLASWGTRGLKTVGANGAATALRRMGRQLNPYANVVAARAGSYLATSALICALECASQ